jgi:hypothetical protein
MVLFYLRKCSNAMMGSIKEKTETPSIFWRKAS